MTTYLKSVDPGLTHLHLPTDETHRESLCGIKFDAVGVVLTQNVGGRLICTECCRRRYQQETARVDEARRAMMRAEV
jgi:hypothetical protein